MWFCDDGVEHAIEYRGNAGILDITTICETFDITESAYVYPGSETFIRDFTLTNTSDERQIGTFLYHLRANVNDNDQTFALWDSNWNRLGGREDLRWNDMQGPYELRVWCDDDDAQTEIRRGISLGHTTVGKYLDGRLLVDFTLPAGAETEVSVFTSGGRDSTHVTSIKSDQERRQASVESW